MLTNHHWQCCSESPTKVEGNGSKVDSSVMATHSLIDMRQNIVMGIQRCGVGCGYVLGRLQIKRRAHIITSSFEQTKITPLPLSAVVHGGCGNKQQTDKADFWNKPSTRVSSMPPLKNDGAFGTSPCRLHDLQNHIQIWKVDVTVGLKLAV